MDVCTPLPSVAIGATHEAALGMASRELLAYFRYGVLVLERGARVAIANAEAERIARSDDGISIHHGQLRLGSMKLQIQFESVVRAALSLQSRAAKTRRTIFHVPRPSGAMRYEMLVSSREQPFEGAPALRGLGCLVLLSDPIAITRVSPAQLMNDYGLTLAEARVAIALQESVSLRDAASGLQVSIHTARSHLRSIFAKLQISTQAQLVRMLAASIRG